MLFTIEEYLYFYVRNRKFLSKLRNVIINTLLSYVRYTYCIYYIAYKTLKKNNSKLRKLYVPFYSDVTIMQLWCNALSTTADCSNNIYTNNEKQKVKSCVTLDAAWFTERLFYPVH
jgi:hypothetical protein